MKAHPEPTAYATSLMSQLNLSPSVFSNQIEYIEMAKLGISGGTLKKAVELTGNRELFVRLLCTSPSNISRFYKRKNLDEGNSEKILDTLSLYTDAERVFGSMDLANEWFEAKIPALGGKKPNALFDTFKGRAMVTKALRKIEYGEFI